jgi:MinD-like ATPase involved in chromosome partitioning or flagellar assembly
MTPTQSDNPELISTNRHATPQEKKRVVFTMGGKGGVGKTSVVLSLAEWFQAHQVKITLLDLDSENKAAGSLKHYFSSSAHQVNIHTAAGLDAFVDYLTNDGPTIILADMGGGSGQVALDWFDTMYPEIAPLGIAFTAIGVITPDPASVQSLLAWASRLRDRVQYLVVENAANPQADFSYWDGTEQAGLFRDQFQPLTLSMEFRLPDLENAARQHGYTLGQVARRAVSIPLLQKTSLVLRAQAYNRRLFLEFDKALELLVP